ncbi:MAG: HPr family phosphocarrier protein [Desulfobacterales bacterium]|jgi:phosphocarrier protein|nr:HPr family phosphocarrier protein [Desulfobacteraceae bacterium]MDD3992500.1 HPr family phosphocarrier protein [Desulfobacteraceae bacterium]MDY0311177.1 HPr family phosphocarrier protein [Desulfobacterales bacterium]
MDSLSRTVRIINPLGLHARAAARLAAVAGRAAGPVWLIRADERVDATSIIDILTLACLPGSVLTIEVHRPEDQAILDQLVQLVVEGFGE